MTKMKRKGMLGTLWGWDMDGTGWGISSDESSCSVTNVLVPSTKGLSHQTNRALRDAMGRRWSWKDREGQLSWSTSWHHPGTQESLCRGMMEAVSTSKTSVNFYQTTRRNNSEDSHLRTHRRENLKSYNSEDSHQQKLNLTLK
jgi:hypothetical protein